MDSISWIAKNQFLDYIKTPPLDSTIFIWKNVVIITVTMLAYRLAGIKGFFYSWVIIQTVREEYIIWIAKLLAVTYFNSPSALHYVLLVWIIAHEIGNIREFLAVRWFGG